MLRDGSRSPGPTALRATVIVLVIGVAIAVGYATGWLDAKHVADVLRGVRNGHGTVLAGTLFFVIDTLITAAGFPTLPFTVAGGAIFGHLLGTLLSWAGALLGSIIGYALARSIGRDAARRWIERRRPPASLAESTSFMTLLRLRLVPIIPLSVVNFAAGLARMHFGVYVAATAIGILPTTVVFAYFADRIVLGMHGARTHAYMDVVFASAALLLLTIIPALVKRRGS